MTIGLEKALGLPSLSDLLKQNNIAAESKPDPSFTDVEIADDDDSDHAGVVTGDLKDALDAIGHGEDHGKAMDVIYDETLRTARDTVDLAYQVDMARQARFLEVANGLFKTAIDAKNSKRDFQLKSIKMAIELRHADLEIKQASGLAGTGPVIQTDAVFHTDRNEIIAQAIAARKKKVLEEAASETPSDTPAE